MLSLLFLSLAAHAAPLSLPEAVRFAIEHSPTLDSSLRAASIAELQYRNAGAAFLPSLDLSATHGFKRTKLPNQPVTDPPWVSDLNVALTETLYDNGQSITKLKIASLTSDIARINYEGARARLALDVTKNFYAYSLNQKLLEVAKSRTSILGKQFSTVSAQYRQGMKTRQDFLRFKTQVQQAEIDLLSAENNIRLSGAELRTLLGVPLSEPTPPEFAPAEPQPLDTKKDVPQAAPPIEKVYEYRAGKLSLEVNELNETFARRLWLPQISITGGTSFDNTGYLGRSNPAFAQTNALSWNGQVVLTYNIFDWGTKWRNVEIAEHTHAQQDNAVTSTNLGLRQSLETLLLTLSTLRESYRLNSELLELSTSSYTFLEEEYRRGRISYLDIITGLNDLLTARTQYLNSYYSLMQNLAQYRYYEGTLYESLSAQK